MVVGERVWRGLARWEHFTWTQIPALGWADKVENSLWENTHLRGK